MGNHSIMRIVGTTHGTTVGAPRLSAIVRQGADARTVQRRAERVTREKWCSIPTALGMTPEPRHPFADAARRDGTRAYTPWRYIAEPVRACIALAVQSGDRSRMEAVRASVVAFFRALEADVLAALPLAADADLTTHAVAVTKESSEAIQACIRAAAHATSLADLERAEIEAQEAIAQLTALAQSCRRRARMLCGAASPTC